VNIIWQGHEHALADPPGHEGMGIIGIINHGFTLRPLLVYIYPRKARISRPFSLTTTNWVFS
jgi:hypothetical protein